MHELIERQGDREFRTRAERALRFALWWCRDGIPFGVKSTTHDGLRILSVCAVCHRVRNAGGDWATLPEQWWPRPHVLSHGHCPECADRELWSFFSPRDDAAGHATSREGTEVPHE